MRISDWSSDVCSSDLIGVRAHPFRHRAGPCPCYLLVKAVLRCQTAQRRRHSGGIVTPTRKILDSKIVSLCFLASGITERNELGARADALLQNLADLCISSNSANKYLSQKAKNGDDRKRTSLNSRHQCASR